MPERTIKRPAGVTRMLKNTDADDADDRLATVDNGTWTRPQLDLVATDLKLSTAGTDAEVAARIKTAIEGAA